MKLTLDQFFQELDKLNLALSARNGDLLLSSKQGASGVSVQQQIRENGFLGAFIKEHKKEILSYILTKAAAVG